MPFFNQIENENLTFSFYSNSGLIQVPLFKGPINRKCLLQAMKTKNPEITLMNDRELTYLQPTSLIVKIHDNQQRKI